MDAPTSNIDFNLMSLVFWIRDLFSPPMNVLKEAGIKEGFRVLDYGCGPGSYIVPLAQMVGPSGTVYALDLHPLAITKVNNLARKHDLSNVRTIQSDCQTGLPDEHVDTVLLYDVFHDLSQPQAVLAELYRVLGASGTLSFCDHHLREFEIMGNIAGSNRFKLLEKGKKTHSFAKKSPA